MCVMRLVFGSRDSPDISNPVTGIDGHYDTIQIIMSRIIIAIM